MASRPANCHEELDGGRARWHSSPPRLCICHLRTDPLTKPMVSMSFLVFLPLSVLVFIVVRLLRLPWLFDWIPGPSLPAFLPPFHSSPLSPALPACTHLSVRLR